jgi:hypothetical protein
MKPSNEPSIDLDNNHGLTKKDGAYYWFSLDSQNTCLYAGIGETRLENVIYSYNFSNENKKDTKLFLESLVSIHCENLEIIRLVRDPITSIIPLLVKNTNELTMEDIAKGTYMPKSNLSVMSQKLYDCIAGNKFVLNTPDFPDFIKAIEYSIATPGKWCYECLKEKATEFDKDKPNDKETYLRITLGLNNGESPGIPYVMEIWPIGHYSPVHSHAGANAIIRVLYGNIHVRLFPYLSPKVQSFGSATFKKDDITWVNTTLNQTHQLINPKSNNKTCITIQCYMYDEADNGHYDYFDYIDADGIKQQYEPDSDMDFLAFKALMKQEWMLTSSMMSCCCL